jgi:hypothetical protein
MIHHNLFLPRIKINQIYDYIKHMPCEKDYNNHNPTAEPQISEIGANLRLLQ